MDYLASLKPGESLPPDDPKRDLAIAGPANDASLKHLSVAGDTYTVLISGKQTAGRYCLIEMLVPPGGGPPPHRHDFEEMFSLLDGEIELTFRGQKITARAGDTVNIPANAPHWFVNATRQPARMLCLCSPAGQELFFAEVGDPVEDRNSPPVKLSDAEKAERGKKAMSLAGKYRTEMLKP